MGIGKKKEGNCTNYVNGGKYDTQVFKMMLDTGSTEFWVPCDTCESENCRKHNQQTDSCTISRQDDAHLHINQLSGSVQGDLAKETILVGDEAIPNQVVGFATSEEVPIMKHVIWDGIVGLAQPNQRLKSQGVRPLMDNMIHQRLLEKRGEKNQFSWYLGPNRGSVIFGGADMRQKRTKSEEYVYSPTYREAQWSILVSDVRLVQKNETDEDSRNKRGPLCEDGCNTIVDTGTQLVQGPKEQVNSLLDKVEMNDCSDIKKMPNVVFELQGRKDQAGNQTVVELTLEPEDQVLQQEWRGQMDCVIGIQPENSPWVSGWTLGQVFLKPFQAVFDRENDEIGWVRANMSPSPDPGQGIDSKVTTSRQTDLTRFKAGDKMKHQIKQAIKTQIDKDPQAFISLNNRNPPPVRSRLINKKNK